ncbi:MAG: V-type ATP synthase subunit A [Oscillospiraceae bacterium]|nr:V-type ATP synthase subunit A [Oscillospiraceae bacterium]
MGDGPSGRIIGVNGPILHVSDPDAFRMAEMVLVGEGRLVGEVISVSDGHATVQIYEDPSGLRPGGPVRGSGKPLGVRLGPGIIGGIFDGIQRPLEAIRAESGVYIPKGSRVPSLDPDRVWQVTMRAGEGDRLTGGSVIAEVPETGSVTHRVMVPPGLSGTAESVVGSGGYRMGDALLTLRLDGGGTAAVTMCQEWPVRKVRPVAESMESREPLVTGQRVIDSIFPIAKGGKAALPGGFGTGKTMLQHQLAKWSDADVIVYVGCGERGNEMTQVLEDFAGLKDPKTGKSLMERTTLIANTSNMPVAAREASIYTGVTIAEYYRDMGYHVAIMADSTSRWAEALRELSGRLEEMPAEEGFPAYLASRLAHFYERAGYVRTLGGAEGSVTIIGAVSPQGADFSEPVTASTKRFVRCFWTLDRNLAYARHFPAIQWLTSYSEYLDDLQDWFDARLGPEFRELRAETLRLLNEEGKLMEIVKLIGADVLPEEQKLILEMARVVRVGFIQQNAYHAFDSSVPYAKQLGMLGVMMLLYGKCRALVAEGHPMRALSADPIFAKVTSMKYTVPNDDLSGIDGLRREVEAFSLRHAGGLADHGAVGAGRVGGQGRA